MAVAMVLDFDGTQAQYDAVMADLDLATNPAIGGLVHIAGPYEGGWRVVDVWESQAAFDTFGRERLGAILQKHGLPQPRVQAWPVHNLILGGQA